MSAAFLLVYLATRKQEAPSQVCNLLLSAIRLLRVIGSVLPHFLLLLVQLPVNLLGCTERISVEHNRVRGSLWHGREGHPGSSPGFEG